MLATFIFPRLSIKKIWEWAKFPFCDLLRNAIGLFSFHVRAVWIWSRAGHHVFYVSFLRCGFRFLWAAHNTRVNRFRQFLHKPFKEKKALITAPRNECMCESSLSGCLKAHNLGNEIKSATGGIACVSLNSWYLWNSISENRLLKKKKESEKRVVMRNWNNIIFVGLSGMRRNVWIRRRSHFYCAFPCDSRLREIERNVFLKHLIVMQSVDWRIELLFFFCCASKIEKNEKRERKSKRKSRNLFMVEETK